MKAVLLVSALIVAPIAVATTGAVASSATKGSEQMPGVANPAQAHVDYMLKCQGCHRPEGGGDARTTPVMAGKVSTFLHVPGGRAFLGRVPGVATVDLDDARLAQLVNWTLYRFDAAGLPKDFSPYSSAEIGQLRQDPLRTDASTVRNVLIGRMSAQGINY